MAEEENKNQYVVLARKYRPQTFDDLVGQDALVQTLSNAIANNRLHHAYILTGIRGVGKTTTARIIAKALNCTGKDGKGNITAHPCGECENCKAIAQDRHIDVLEIDAASNTGVDNIREILDGVRYKPTNARFKIYIIDEVHMLSKSAFNALLKTLEEPPSHVKFIFATTEIRKVPVTVLSRCQRFDLQRISAADLTGLFTRILNVEKITFEEEALKIIAKYADGSARDGLSLLDQAIALGNGIVKTEVVKEMIGLTDRLQSFEIFENLVKGDVASTVKKLQEQYKNGADPLSILQDLIGIVHMVTKAKILNNYNTDTDLSEIEKELCAKYAPNLPVAILSKMWQMLVKGISELQFANVQIDALEMILIRVAYSANMPTPAEVLDGLKKNSEIRKTDIPKIESPAPENAPTMVENVPQNTAVQFASFENLIKVLEEKRKAILTYNLTHNVEVKEFADGKIKMILSENIGTEFLNDLHKALKEISGKQWQLDTLYGKAINSLAALQEAKDNKNKGSVAEYPLVKEILQTFPGSKIDSLTYKITEVESANSIINFEEDTDNV